MRDTFTLSTVFMVI